jgi:hypothetical protein
VTEPLSLLALARGRQRRVRPTPLTVGRGHRGIRRGLGGGDHGGLPQLLGAQHRLNRRGLRRMSGRRARLSAALIWLMLSPAARAGSGALPNSSKVSAASRSSNAASEGHGRGVERPVPQALRRPGRHRGAVPVPRFSKCQVDHWTDVPDRRRCPSDGVIPAVLRIVNRTACLLDHEVWNVRCARRTAEHTGPMLRPVVGG